MANVINEIETLKRQQQDLSGQYATLRSRMLAIENSHTSFRAEIAENTRITRETQEGTTEILAIVKGTKAGFRWGGKLAKGAMLLGAFVTSMGATWLVIVHGWRTFLEWIR